MAELGFELDQKRVSILVGGARLFWPPAMLCDLHNPERALTEIWSCFSRQVILTNWVKMSSA